VNTATPLPLREFHQSLGANLASLNGDEIVADYGDALAEHAALRQTAGVLDLSFRSRLCLTGADRVRFLHGQITNDVKRLRPGAGCYAAIVTAKGKMQSDLNVFALPDELLLDFEPGLTATVTARLEKYLVADDVQVVDVAPHYGLLSVQGPQADAVVRAVGLFAEIPALEFNSVKITDATLGEIYLMNQPRLLLPRPATQERGEGRGEGQPQDNRPSSPRPSPPPAGGAGASTATNAGFDLFVPTAALGVVVDKLIAAAKAVGGRACGWTAFEIVRVEAGIPRFGVDMDETNLPLECGIEARAVSYQKGCYIGQEVINRIHSIGHVNRELHGLRLADEPPTLPAKGDKLFHADKEVGHVTSALHSPTLNATIALGYVRRETNAVGTELRLRTSEGERGATIVALPLVK
jgi:folate-binding protein YgfZ